MFKRQFNVVDVLIMQNKKLSWYSVNHHLCFLLSPVEGSQLLTPKTCSVHEEIRSYSNTRFIFGLLMSTCDVMFQMWIESCNTDHCSEKHQGDFTSCHLNTHNCSLTVLSPLKVNLCKNSNHWKLNVMVSLLQNFIDLAGTVSTGIGVSFKIKLFKIRTKSYSKFVSSVFQHTMLSPHCQTKLIRKYICNLNYDAMI